MKHLGLATLALVMACQETVEELPVYQAVAVEARDISLSVQAAGVIEPDTVVEVKSKASGEILEIFVETGATADRGDLLVQIDQRVPRNSLLQSEASLEVAQARLTNAEAQLRRAEELYRTQSITQTEYEAALLDQANAKANLVTAEVQVQNDRIAMEDTDVRAPISGTVISKNVERGQVISSPSRDVSGGTVLLTMADLSLVQVRTLVDETDIGKIRPGMPATVTVAAYPNQPFEGTVLKIEPQALTQQNVTMFPVRVRIENRDDLLRPGMNAEVEVSVGSRSGVLAVPVAALRTDRDVRSAAEVLGITADRLSSQLEAPSDQADGSAAASEEAPAESITLPNGNVVTLPPGVSRDQVLGLMAKRRSGETLSDDERAVLRTVFQRMGNSAGRGAQETGGAPANPAVGGNYIVFVLRNGEPTALRIRTGLNDLDYTEVVSGLRATDSVLLLIPAGAT